MKTYEGSVHKKRSFSVFVHLFCQTKNRGSKMEKNKKKKRRRRVGKWKLTKGSFIKITTLVCSSTFYAKQRTQEVKWKKQKEKTQKTGGQMKRCRVKNCIFRCNKNAEDWEGNENSRRFRLSVYAATVKERELEKLNFEGLNERIKWSERLQLLKLSSLSFGSLAIIWRKLWEVLRLDMEWKERWVKEM